MRRFPWLCLDCSASLVWAALPLLLYLIPLVCGFTWNSLSGPNILNPPEGYTGRLPRTPLTVEQWGSGVVILPFHTRLRQYLADGDLPLWNPYQGLGQPFAAQADGNPFSPLALVRAPLPYSYGPWVTVVAIYGSGLALFWFLEGLGVSWSARLFGAAAFTTSGALSLHLARDNIADQVMLIPVLFWAAERAVRSPTLPWFGALVLAVGLTVIGGFIQIAMVAIMAAGAFIVVYGPRPGRSRRDVVLCIGGGLLAVVVGIGLAGFSLLPTLEAFATNLSQNLRSVFDRPPIPLGNGVAFFLPLFFGHPMLTPWVVPQPPTAGASFPMSWGDLFGFSGMVVLLVVAAGCAVRAWKTPMQRRLYLFFLVVALFFFLRYLGVPPFNLVDLIPPFSQHTKKHANGLTVFLLVVAASLVLDNVHAWRARRALGAGLIAVAVVLLVGAYALLDSAGSPSAVYAALIERGVPFVGVTAAVVAISVAGLGAMLMLRRWSEAGSALFAAGLAVGELELYVPLGSDDPTVLYARVGILLLLAGVGLALALRQWLVAAAVAVVAVGTYGWVVVTPTFGLPTRVEADRPPRFMQWLKPRVGDDFRTYGIFPDFSSLDAIQDLSIVGPLSTVGHLTFVDIVGDDTLRLNYAKVPIFMLANNTFSVPISQYLLTRPMFDWVGVRYLVFSRSLFTGPARQDLDLLTASSDPTLVTAYEDDQIVIVESTTARPKAEFWSWVAEAQDSREIVDTLHDQPALALQQVFVDADAHINLPTSPPVTPVTGSVSVVEYRPNRVALDVVSNGPGLVVLKDVFAPGWTGTLDGLPVSLARVDGMLRGAVVPTPGHHRLEMVYEAPGFVIGLQLATIIAITLLLLVGLSMRWPAPWLKPAAGLAGVAAGVATLMLVGWSYFALDDADRADRSAVATARSSIALTSGQDGSRGAVSSPTPTPAAAPEHP